MAIQCIDCEKLSDIINYIAMGRGCTAQLNTLGGIILGEYRNLELFLKDIEEHFGFFKPLFHWEFNVLSDMYYLLYDLRDPMVHLVINSTYDVVLANNLPYSGLRLYDSPYSSVRSYEPLNEAFRLSDLGFAYYVYCRVIGRDLVKVQITFDNLAGKNKYLSRWREVHKNEKGLVDAKSYLESEGYFTEYVPMQDKPGQFCLYVSTSDLN